MFVETKCKQHTCAQCTDTANLRAKTLDFRGFDSIRVVIPRVGILTSMGNFPEILSQTVLAGVVLVGRLRMSCMCAYMYIYIYIYVCSRNDIVLVGRFRRACSGSARQCSSRRGGLWEVLQLISYYINLYLYLYYLYCINIYIYIYIYIS